MRGRIDGIDATSAKIARMKPFCLLDNTHKQVQFLLYTAHAFFFYSFCGHYRDYYRTGIITMKPHTLHIYIHYVHTKNKNSIHFRLDYNVCNQVSIENILKLFSN